MTIAKFFTTLVIVIFGCCTAFSQTVNQASRSIVWDLGPEDPRIDLKFGTKGINVGGYEDTAPIIKNNFGDELSIKVQFTLIDYCGGSKVYTATKVLKGNQVWAPNPFMEGFIFDSKCKTIQEYGAGQKLKTRISRVDWQVLSLRNLTEEKKNEAEEKARKEQEAAAQRAQSTTAGPEVNDKAKTGADAANEATSADEKESTATPSARQHQENQQEAASPTTTSAAEQAEAQREAEEAQARERQSKYDEWKKKKNEERQIQDAASVAASASFLYFIGGMIYNGMDSYNPDLSYEVPAYYDRYKPVFYAGVEVGYSATFFPMLFNSDKTTMVNGSYVSENSMINKSIFTANLNVTGKIGLESDGYGAYAYVAPQVGFVPTFNGYNVSPLAFGGRVYAGVKWVKVYADYRIGSRKFHFSSLEAEEDGHATFVGKIKRMEYGLRFTTNPDDDYRRSHLSIGLISETYEVADGVAYLDPDLRSLRYGRTPAIQGYAFQWKKDHAFNFYVNVIPGYLWGGEISTGGPISSETPDTGVYVEIGFVRSFDFFSRRLR